jgi:hypothetical protein
VCVRCKCCEEGAFPDDCEASLWEAISI